MASELERMGDHAEGIARIVVLMRDETLAMAADAYVRKRWYEAEQEDADPEQHHRFSAERVGQLGVVRCAIFHLERGRRGRRADRQSHACIAA